MSNHGGSPRRQPLNSVGLTGQFPGLQSRHTSQNRGVSNPGLSALVLQDSNQLALNSFPSRNRDQSDWMTNRLNQPIRRLNVRNLRTSVLQQPEVRLVNLGTNTNHNDNNNNRRNINTIRVIRDPRLVHRILTRTERPRQTGAQPTLVRFAQSDRSLQLGNQRDQTYVLLTQPTSRPVTPVHHIAVVNRPRPFPLVRDRHAVGVAAIGHGQSHTMHRTEGKSQPTKAPVLAGKVPLPASSITQVSAVPVQVITIENLKPPVVQAPARSHVPVQVQTAPVAKQHHHQTSVSLETHPGHMQQTADVGLPEVPSPQLTSNVQNTASVGIPGQPLPKQPSASTHTSDPLFDELVIAFEEALLNQSASGSPHSHQHAAATHPHVHAPSPLAPGYYHPQTALANFQGHMGAGGFHDPYSMFGNPFGFVSPWMMDSAARQEMLFGDTTDPPVPTTSATTTVAPKIVPANPLSANGTAAAIAPTEPAITTPVTTPPLPTGSQPSLVGDVTGPSSLSAHPDFSTVPPESPPKSVVDGTGFTKSTTRSTMPVVTTKSSPPLTGDVIGSSTFAPRSEIPVVTKKTTKPPKSTDLFVEARPLSVQTVNQSKTPKENPSISSVSVEARPAILSQLTNMLTNSKADVKVIEAAIQQAVSALGKIPPELEIIAKQLGIVVGPTSFPVQTETLPTMEQLGVTMPEPGS